MIDDVLVVVGIVISLLPSFPWSTLSSKQPESLLISQECEKERALS